MERVTQFFFRVRVTTPLEKDTLDTMEKRTREEEVDAPGPDPKRYASIRPHPPRLRRGLVNPLLESHLRVPL